MNFKKQRGTAIIEYVIILAFICGIGASFTSDGLTKPINSIIGKVAAILDLDFDNGGGNLLAGKSDSAVEKGFQGGGGFSYLPGVAGIGGLDGGLLELSPDTTYEISIDLEQVAQLGLDPDNIGLCIFIWDQNDFSSAANFNTGGIKTTSNYEVTNKNNGDASGQYGGVKAYKTVSDDSKTMTISFTTKDSAYLGMNFECNTNSDRLAKTQEVANNYKNFINLKAVPKSTT